MKKSVKVAHLADIHWRSLKRHDEYRAVFEEFFQRMQEEKPDRILIAGDIVHSKLQGITPELIRNLVWWFEGLGRICPVIVVLGNHDGLILNRSRLDAITPVIESINNKNIIFLKDSCVYRDEQVGIAWCNLSCFDEENWKNVEPTEDLVNVSIYHGAVRGALADSDWEINHESGLTIKDFSQFDYGMFGDIHKFQFLDLKQKFAYPGSTIQQNYGESQDKGYLVWEISGKDKWKVRREVIESPFPYVTIDWMGTVLSTFEACRKHKKGSRFRIVSKKQVFQEEFKQLSALLQERMKSSEVIWKLVDDPQAQQAAQVTALLQRENFRDTSTQLDLLKQFYLEDKDMSQEDWVLAENLVKSALSSITDQEHPRNTKWTLDRMTWDNTFSYGPGNEINFHSVSGIVGIFGPNRIGKSSIVGTLMYALFNDTDRGSISNLNVINTTKDYCTAKVDFTVGSKKYRAERATVKNSNKKGQISAPTTLGLFELDENGNVCADLSGEQRNESEKILRSIIGRSEEFLLTTFASQGEMNQFIKQGATNRKNYLNSFLDIGIFSEIHRWLKEESIVFKSKVKDSAVNYDDSLSIAREEQQENTKKRMRLESELSLLREKITSLNVVLATHKNGDKVTKSDVASAESKLKRAKDSYKSKLDEIDTINGEISQFEERQRKIENLQKIFPIQEYRDGLMELQELAGKYSTLSAKLDREVMVLNNQAKSVKKLESVPCGDSYPTCMFIKDSHRDKQLIVEQQATIDRLESSITEASAQLKSLKEKDIESKIKKYESFVTEYNNNNQKMKLLGEKIKFLNDSLSSDSSTISSLETNLASMRLKVVSDESTEELENLKSEISETQASIRQKETQMTNTDLQLGRLKEKIERLISDKENYESAKKRWKVFDKLINAYSKNGIPFNILTKELPRINQEIHSILQGIVNFDVILSSPEGSNDLEIYLDYGDSYRPIELGSGMEKMISSLAIRVALTNMSSLPKTDVLIIDEGFGALDDAGIESCNKMLASLKKYFKSILVISHVDAVKEAVDEMIEINQVSKDSYVKHV
jgi:DNA repair exonuclease SbcCD ATPase subunit/DNA repair exonuclease SbcCD nuclease subunit